MGALLTPSPRFLELLEGLDEDMILVGPGGDPDQVLMDDILGKDFKTCLQQYMQDAGIEQTPAGILTQAVTTPIDLYINSKMVSREAIWDIPDVEIIIVPTEDATGVETGVAALLQRSTQGQYRIAGLFHGCDLSVDPLYQGYGIGTALVAARLLRDEALPTWDHDRPGYSHAGAETVRRALTTLQIMAEKQREKASDQESHPCL